MQFSTALVATLAAVAAANPVAVEVVEERQLGGLLCTIFGILPPIGGTFCCEATAGTIAVGASCDSKLSAVRPSSRRTSLWQSSCVYSRPPRHNRPGRVLCGSGY
jgi:hypothetical protein